MIIVQISDCHIARPRRAAYGNVDAEELLQRAVDCIRAMPRRPDLILATGDLADGGRREEYDVFAKIMGEIDVPLLPVAGNHDDRDMLATAFGLRSSFSVQPHYIQYAVDGFPVRILVIDTTTPKSGEPSFCAERLSWIEAELSKDSRPVLIAMHHPPFPAGVRWMEPRIADWAAPLADIVSGHPAIVRVVCGHVHRTMTATWGRTVAMAAPSTAHQVFLDLTPAGRPRFSAEAPGFLIHTWTGSDLISYGAATPGFFDTIDLSPTGTGSISAAMNGQRSLE
jgi:3',5'-cyclic-AMP phosphodiesterase